MSNLKFNCIHCGQHLEVDATGSGMTVACPKCSQAITVPTAATQPSAQRAVAQAGTNRWRLWTGVAAVVLLALGSVWFLIFAKAAAGSSKGSSEPAMAEKRDQSGGSATQSARATTESGLQTQPGSLDTAFDTGAGVEGHGWVSSLAVQPDGKLIIGGQFSEVNGQVRQNLARLNSSGSVDVDFQTTVELDDDVSAGSAGAIALQPDGKIVLSGNFKTVNGTPRYGLARLTQDGRLDGGYQPELPTNSFVSSVTFQPDGRLIAGGSFSNASSHVVSGLVRINADGKTDIAYQPEAVKDSLVRSVLVQKDHRLLVSGYRGIVASPSSPLLVRLMDDGTVDSSFKAPSIGTGAFRYALTCFALQSDRKILIAGTFTNINGRARNRIARLNPDGSLDESFDAGNTLPEPPQALAVQSDGRVWVAGVRSAAGGLIRLQKNGQLDTSFTKAKGALGRTSNSGFLCVCLGVKADGGIWVGGSFQSIGGMPCNRVACLNPDGSLDRNIDLGSGVRGGRSLSIRAVALQPDGKTLACGSFWKFKGVACGGATRLNQDGSVDAAFAPGFSPYTIFESVSVLADGKLLFGGDFTEVQGRPRAHLVRLNADGTLDNTFKLDPAVKDGDARPQPDGKLLVLGNYERQDGVRRNRLYRLNADGSFDPGFDAGSAPDGPLWATVRQPDGKIIISGWFKNVSGVARPYIARLNADGSVDRNFNVGSGPDTAVFAVALQPDGRIVIGGGFTNVNGTSCQQIARLNADGSLDPGFRLDAGMDKGIHCLTLQPDGRVLAGGWFENVAGVPRRHIARLNPDGTLDTTFDPGAGANSLVSRIVLDKNGDMVIGGHFSTFDNRPCRGIARLHGDRPAGKLKAPEIPLPKPATATADSQSKVTPVQPGGVPDAKLSVAERLQQLKAQLENKVITPEDYEKRKKEIMDSL